MDKKQYGRILSLLGLFVIIFLAFMLDRVSKWWMADYLTQHGTVVLHPLLSLRLTYNAGMSLGLFQGTASLLGWVTVFIVAGLFIYMLRLPQTQWIVRVGLAILIGGALGNLVDRVFAGEVLDFVDIPFSPGIFNVADVLIYVGMFVLLFGSWWHGRKQDEEADPDTDTAVQP